MSISYGTWLEQEYILANATPQTYARTLHDTVVMLLEDAKERALQEEDNYE